MNHRVAIVFNKPAKSSLMEEGSQLPGKISLQNTSARKPGTRWIGELATILTVKTVGNDIKL